LEWDEVLRNSSALFSDGGRGDMAIQGDIRRYWSMGDMSMRIVRRDEERLWEEMLRRDAEDRWRDEEMRRDEGRWGIEVYFTNELYKREFQHSASGALEREEKNKRMLMMDIAEAGTWILSLQALGTIFLLAIFFVLRYSSLYPHLSILILFDFDLILIWFDLIWFDLIWFDLIWCYFILFYVMLFYIFYYYY
jgi:hypothetical protein